MRVIVAGRLSRKATDRDQSGFDSQEREAVRWAQQHEHEVVAVVADYRSGRSGLEARPNLRPWVTEPDKIAQYDAIVALKVDRLTRGNREETTKLETWAREHGKQLMMAGAGVQFPSEGRDGIAWDLYLRMAHDEWLQISERYTRMLREKREQGSAAGRAPWGYRIEKCDGKKIFVPTPEGRKWVPQIFEAVINGMSLRNVAAWVEAEGLTALGGFMAVERLVTNPIYYGQRRNSGQLETEALVGFSVWQQAGEALKSRAKPGRGTVKREKALLKPVCGNPNCNATGPHPSPMYRQFSKATYGYYYCNGRGPRPKGCGHMYRETELDANVRRAMANMKFEHIEREFVAGDDRSDEIGKLRQRAADALIKGDDDTADSLRAQAKALAAEPTKKPGWKPRKTGITEADYFASLDLDGQREYLAQRWIVMADRKGAPLGGVVMQLRPPWDKPDAWGYE